jgi:hypothetical protein
LGDTCHDTRTSIPYFDNQLHAELKILVAPAGEVTSVSASEKDEPKIRRQMLIPISWLRNVMSQKSQPKFRLSKRLESGDFLAMSVWPGKSNPEDEVINVQIRRFQQDWKTIARLAVYRTKSGTYSELPEAAKAS